ncbi:unnamed protein product, partial [Laminaria digitata]
GGCVFFLLIFFCHFAVLVICFFAGDIIAQPVSRRLHPRGRRGYGSFLEGSLDHRRRFCGLRKFPWTMEVFFDRGTFFRPMELSFDPWERSFDLWNVLSTLEYHVDHDRSF